jgi:tetratricopeptide (TPR) repeat protein
MSEHGGPAGADGVDDGRGHAYDIPKMHGIPDAREGESPAATRPPFLAAGATGARSFEPALDAGQGQHLSHLSKDALWRFMTGGLSAAEMRHVFGHLLRGCASCRAQAREVWNLTLPSAIAAASADAQTATPPPAGTVETAGQPFSYLPNTALEPHLLPPADAQGPLDAPDFDAAQRPEAAPVAAAGSPNETAYDTVLDRVFSRIALEEAGIEVARRRAADLFEELMQHPPAHQELLVHNSARFRDRMLCERLLAASHDEGFREPARSQQLARLAVAVAERVADAFPETTLESSAPAQSDALAGLGARAWAQLGNALRICSDLEGASTAFRSAEALLAANPRLGLLDKARVFDLKASLCRDRRQFAEAARLLDRVIAIYRRLDQPHLMGRALAQKGMLQFYARDLESCMVLLRRALELIDPHEDPRGYLVVRHNLITALVDDGKPREAFALLFHTRPLYLKMGDRMNLLRLRWLEGQVAQGLHRLDQAEAAFREVRDAFLELEIEYDAALVSLDLAAVLAEQGRTPDMRRLAEELLVFFESHQILPEAMAALLVFCNAARIEQAGLALVQEVMAFLKQARHTPDLRFAPRR